MPTFLSDPPPALYLTLLLAALIAGGLWARYRRRSLLVAAGVVVALLVLLFALDRTNESPREQAVRRVNDMAAALTAKNWQGFSEHVSESFDANGMKKADLRRGFDLGVQHGVRAVAWEFGLAEPVTYTDESVVIRFDAKAETPSGAPLAKHIQATFAKDPDGQFRMRSFATFNIVQKKVAEPIPGVTR
jgi:uncharacterized membrane protein